MAKDVFISYKSEEFDSANMVRGELEMQRIADSYRYEAESILENASPKRTDTGATGTSGSSAARAA